MNSKVIIVYNNLVIKATIGSDNTNIEKSFKIKSIKDMKAVLLLLREQTKLSSIKYAIDKRSLFSMINEWRVHNLLYALCIEKDRTISVDLNTGQKWYIKVLYTLLSPFYLHFT
jgi:hypothetical protein